MIKGIGIDMTTISEIKSIMQTKAFVSRTFTEEEQKNAEKSDCPEEYLATRFAAKEAVYKAIASNVKNKKFDMRIVETLNDKNGKPYINCSKELDLILKECSISNIHISITTEGDFATAFVIAEE